MAENQTPKPSGPNAASGEAAGSSAAGIPFYEKQRQHLKELISRRRALEKKLVRPTRPGSANQETVAN
jgi:chromatin modification-related protein EAF6